jgi:hypothetical protein
VVREFQVVTSGGIAEYGRASAGSINVVTKSGGNAWHGRVYGFLRNQRLDARNPIFTRKDPLTQTQFGASGSGPLRRDRTFLFGNFEQSRQNAAGFISIAPENARAVERQTGRPLPVGEYPQSLVAATGFLRLDHHLSAGRAVSARYAVYDAAGENARGVGGLNGLSRGSALANRDHSLALTFTNASSPVSIQEARAQFTRNGLAAPINDPAGPAINISGVANLGSSVSSPVARDNDLAEAAASLSAIRGRHSIRAGGSYLRNDLTIVFPGAAQGVYTFSSLATLASGRYITYQQAFGAAAQQQANPNAGAFFQDEWRPRPSLTVNWGARYDAQWVAGPIEANRNFSPRLGVAWSPDGQKTVVRASGGLYYDRIPLRAVSNALQRDGVRYRTAVLSYGVSGAPMFPDRLPAFPDGLLTSISAMDPAIQPAAGAQGNFQMERQVASAGSLQLGYVYLRGTHLILSRNVNAPTDPSLPNLGRPDGRFANISRYEGSGDSYYHGLIASWQTRAGRWGSLRTSYTWSKAIDNAGNFFFSSPQNNADLRDERGLSDNDQRHRVVMSGTVEHGGFRLSSIYSYSSALPFNVLTGTDRNGDTNVNDRPAGVGRNTGRAFPFRSLDVRLSRRFRISERAAVEAIVESFNLLNRANWLFPNSIFGPGAAPLAAFGRPTAAADPRQVQLGLRIDF